MSISVQVSFRTVVFSGYMNLTETEEIKKMWQEYTEELYKKVDPENHDGVFSPRASSGPSEASLQTKLEKVMECQLKYFRS